jgi:hypothetical protein
MVVEAIGAGFDKPPDAAFFTFRFPRILKIHRDRSDRDALIFVEYQHLADESRLLAHREGGQLEKHWLKRLGIGGLNRRCHSSDTESQGSTQVIDATDSGSDTESLLSVQGAQLDERGERTTSRDKITPNSGRSSSLKRGLTSEAASDASTPGKKPKKFYEHD